MTTKILLPLILITLFITTACTPVEIGTPCNEHGDCKNLDCTNHNLQDPVCWDNKCQCGIY